MSRRHSGQSCIPYDFLWNFFTVPLGEEWFVVKEVHLRRRARLTEIDHTLRPGREMGKARKASVGHAFWGSRRCTLSGGEQLVVHQAGQGRRAEPKAAQAEKEGQQMQEGMDSMSKTAPLLKVLGEQGGGILGGTQSQIPAGVA